MPPPKLVTIRVVEKQGYHAKELNRRTRYRISSVYKNQQPLRALSPEEEVRLLPEVIGIQPNDPSFARAVRHYWADFVINVPKEGGKILNCDMYPDTEPPVPVNINDYIAYRFCEVHPLVAMSLAEAKSNGALRFYVHDSLVENELKTQEVKQRTAAYSEFTKVMESDTKMEMMLRMLGNINPSTLSIEEKQIILEKALQSNPDAFIKLSTDSNLALRAFIVDLLGHNIIRQAGNSYLYIDQTLGESETEVVNYLKNPRYSGILVELKAKLKDTTGREFPGAKKVEPEESEAV